MVSFCCKPSAISASKSLGASPRGGFLRTWYTSPSAQNPNRANFAELSPRLAFNQRPLAGKPFPTVTSQERGQPSYCFRYTGSRRIAF